MPAATGAGQRNAAKKLATTATPPWKLWKEQDRVARAIRFIETYCISPKGFGFGKPLKLAQFQKDFLESALEVGVSSAILELPRGNGKSTFLAAFALWSLFDDDATGAGQIPVVATTVGQAIRSTYGVAVAMVRAHLDLDNRAQIYSGIGTQRIVVPFNGSECFPIADSEAGLQGLDPSLAVADEIGFLAIESWNSLLLAGGKRPRSLCVGIGTPGVDRHNALWHLRTRARSGDATPGFRFTEFAAAPSCDIRDETQWRNANPAIDAGYMDIQKLRDALAITPEASFRIFRLGQWIDGYSSWLGEDGRKLWDSLIDLEASLIPGAETWVGVDIGFSSDSTAIVAAQRNERNGFYVHAWIQSPNPGGTLDVQQAMAYLRELCDTYHVQRIAYDPRLFEIAADQLAQEGLPMLEFPQTLARMIPAVGVTYQMIKREEITHSVDIAFSDHVLNAQAKPNESGFTLEKRKSHAKIDAAVAMCLAVQVALTQQPEPTPQYLY